jgi:hypothetical protein
MGSVEAGSVGLVSIGSVGLGSVGLFVGSAEIPGSPEVGFEGSTTRWQPASSSVARIKNHAIIFFIMIFSLSYFSAPWASTYISHHGRILLQRIADFVYFLS